MKIKTYIEIGAYVPQKAHTTDAGFDIRTPEEVVVEPRSSAIIDTGVHMEIPEGYVGMLKSKSGLNVKSGILSEGVVDAGYVGSIVVKLYNNSDKPKYFEKGDKITQIVIMPIPFIELEEVDNLGEFEASERGADGFGSTGR
jgi:dUTP pyrophosphatase